MPHIVEEIELVSRITNFHVWFQIKSTCSHGSMTSSTSGTSGTSSNRGTGSASTTSTTWP